MITVNNDCKIFYIIIMTDFKKLSLNELKDKGISDFQIKVDPNRVNPKSNNSILANIPLSLWLLGGVIIALILFGIANVPIYIWYFFYK